MTTSADGGQALADKMDLAVNRQCPARRSKRKRDGLPAADRMLASARELFYRRGTQSVSVDELVADADVSKPTFYRHFGSKAEAVVAYLRECSEEFWADFEAIVGRYPDDPRKQILGYFRELGEQVAHPNYRGCGLTKAAMEFPGRDHPGWRVIDQHKTRVRERLTGIVVSIDVASPSVAADGLLMLMEGAFAGGYLFGSKLPTISLVDVATNLIDRSWLRSGQSAD